MARTIVSLGPVLSRLEELARLEPDWDTYGGAPPSEVALAAARLLVARVAEELGDALGDACLPYDLAPIADGGTGIEWRAPDRSLEVWIGPEGSLGYLLTDGSGEERKFTEVAAASAEDVASKAVCRQLAEAVRVVLPPIQPAT